MGPMNGNLQYGQAQYSAAGPFNPSLPGPQFAGSFQGSSDYSTRPERDGDVRVLGEGEIIKYSRLPDRGGSGGFRTMVSEGDSQIGSFSVGSQVARTIMPQGDSQINSFSGGS